jgi:broad specificity phosphatase PhoE
VTIYLVRHGLAAAGTEDLDPGLAPLGYEQARAAAGALQAMVGRRGVRVEVSPLRRTRETAGPICEALGATARLCQEVSEVFDPSWPVDRRRAMIGPFLAGRWSDQPAELQAWRDRVVATLVDRGAGAEREGADLVVVSHYVAIGAAIGRALGDDRVAPVGIANCSITSLDVGPAGGLVLREAASAAHLSPEQVTGVGTALAGGPGPAT